MFFVMTSSFAHCWAGDWPLTVPAMMYAAGKVVDMRWSAQPCELNAQVIQSWYMTQLDPSVASLIVGMQRSSLMMTEVKQEILRGKKYALSSESLQG